MRQYAIMRTEKIKSRVSLAGALRHNSRENSPVNADPSRKAQNYNSGPVRDALEQYTKLLPQKVRKDAVHAVEFVCTASAEWYEANPDKQKQMLRKSVEWVSKLFGSENILHVAFHADEEVPHLHVIAMPLVNGKLNAKALIGGHRDRMRDLQDDYFEYVGKPLGMERGVRRNKPIRHTKPRELARLRKELQDGLEQLDIDRAKLNAARMQFHDGVFTSPDLRALFEKHGFKAGDEPLFFKALDKALVDAKIERDRIQKAKEATPVDSQPRPVQKPRGRSR